MKLKYADLNLILESIITSRQGWMQSSDFGRVNFPKDYVEEAYGYIKDEHPLWITIDTSLNYGWIAMVTKARIPEIKEFLSLGGFLQTAMLEQQQRNKEEAAKQKDNYERDLRIKSLEEGMGNVRATKRRADVAIIISSLVFLLEVVKWIWENAHQ